VDHAHLNLRVPTDFKKRLNDHRIETGIPNAVFVRRIVDAAIEQWRRESKPKQRRRAAG